MDFGQRPLNFFLVSFLSSLPSLPCSSCFHLLTWQFLLPLHCLRSAQLPRMVSANGSMWCWLPQGCLKVKVLQELLSWGLPTPAVLGPCHSHSAFVAMCNQHCPSREEGHPEGLQEVPAHQHTPHRLWENHRELLRRVTCVPNAATSHSRSYRSMESLWKAVDV